MKWPLHFCPVNLDMPSSAFTQLSEAPGSPDIAPPARLMLPRASQLWWLSRIIHSCVEFFRIPRGETQAPEVFKPATDDSEVQPTTNYCFKAKFPQMLMFERNITVTQLFSRKKKKKAVSHFCVTPSQAMEETVCLPLEEPRPWWQNNESNNTHQACFLMSSGQNVLNSKASRYFGFLGEGNHVNIKRVHRFKHTNSW